jgi:predicted ATPase
VSFNQQLNVLEGSSLIWRFATQPELEYLFRHALVQEATHSAVLHADRRLLHRVVGQTLERLYADRLDALSRVNCRPGAGGV